jgi:hypothetical protein
LRLADKEIDSMKGGFTGKESEGQYFSKALADGILVQSRPRTLMLDLGCSLGRYVGYWRGAGRVVIGVDTPEVAAIAIEKLDIFAADLMALFLEVPWGVIHHSTVICLEVGEHIPVEFESVFLDNVCRYASMLFLSWAVPGQGGLRHVNERPNEYVIAQVEKRGLKFCKQDTDWLRERVKNDPCHWFKNTVIVYRR